MMMSMSPHELSLSPGARVAESDAASLPTPEDRGVAAWLFLCCAAVGLMVVIGGITRLTDSGLSIAEWRPLIGTLPPLTDAEWSRIFDLYRQTSEYRLQNAGMSLAEFQSIFWWEYLHRLWGRLIGVVFLLPLVWFAVRGRLSRGLGVRLLGIFALGGLQGAIGWWMVASGLVDRVDVSAYRLAVHLGIAFLIYGLIFWLWLDLVDRRRGLVDRSIRRLAWLGLGMVSLTIVAGAFVAGNKAGLIYNTFPLMGGQIVPPDYAAAPSLTAILFENPASVQFNHRIIAIVTVALVSLLWWRARADSSLAFPVTVLALIALMQAALGISTVLLVVPLPLAIAHQFGALLLLTAALWVTHRVRS